jgi:hypothetical protein
MIRILLAMVGLILAVGALYPVWVAFDAHDKIRGYDNEIVKVQSEMARSHKKEDPRIGEFQAKMGEATNERNTWAAAACASLIVGLGLVLIPGSKRRKRSVVESAPAVTTGEVSSPLSAEAPAVEGIGAEKPTE